MRHSTSAIDANVVARLRHSSKCRALAGSVGYRPARVGPPREWTRDAVPRGYASGRSSTPFTMENTAVEAPSVNANVATTAGGIERVAPESPNHVAKIDQNAVHGDLDEELAAGVAALRCEALITLR